MTDNRPLEAPDCPLCHPAGEDVLWQDERLRVIHVGTEAGQPAYFRVIWQQHLPEMTDLSDADRLYLWRVLSVLEDGVRRHFRPAKVNLASFGNQVPHLHWHIIGRWPSDPQFPGSVWSPVLRPADSEEHRAVAERVSAALPAFRSWLAGALSACRSSSGPGLRRGPFRISWLPGSDRAAGRPPLHSRRWQAPGRQ